MKIYENRGINSTWKEESPNLKTKILHLKDTLLNVEVELM